MVIARYKYESDWSYETSTAGGATLAFVSGEKGKLFLNSPTGQSVMFNYVAAGVGGGASFKIPKVGKLEVTGIGKKSGKAWSHSVGGTYASKDWYSKGKVYVLESFKGADLSAKDFIGFCLLMEASVGFVVGAAASVLITGLSPHDLQQGLMEELLIDTALPPLFTDELNKRGITNKMGITGATAAIHMFGVNQGAQAGAGVAAMLGYLSLGAPPDDELLTRFELRQENEQIIDIRQTAADHGTVVVRGNALFKFGKYDLRPEAKQVLEKVGDFLRSQSALQIFVNGHTDSIGDAGFNMTLSRWRAKTVAEWLRRYLAPTTADIRWEGRGEEDPVAANTSSFGRQLNRRVVISYDRYKR